LPFVTTRQRFGGARGSLACGSRPLAVEPSPACRSPAFAGPGRSLRSLCLDSQGSAPAPRRNSAGARSDPRQVPRQTVARSDPSSIPVGHTSAACSSGETGRAVCGALHTRRVLLVVPLSRMEAKQVMRQAVQLAYTPRIVAKSGRPSPAYSVGWTFDAAVVVLLVASATLYFAA
jgi:hypothetical protein